MSLSDQVIPVANLDCSLRNLSRNDIPCRLFQTDCQSFAAIPIIAPFGYRHKAVPLLTLSVGSNVNPHANIRRAVGMLRARFSELHCSPVYESKAVGFEGDNFLNLVICTETEMALDAISRFLKGVEDQLERDRSQPRFSARPMDIDILAWGRRTGEVDGVQLPRDEILRHAFVLQPLADLLPEELHPENGKSYGRLWQELRPQFEANGQRLWPVEFDWRPQRDNPPA